MVLVVWQGLGGDDGMVLLVRDDDRMAERGRKGRTGRRVEVRRRRGMGRKVRRK